jgi:hypothetical protein
MANNNSKPFLTFLEYQQLAYSKGYNNMIQISLATHISYDVLANLSSRRTQEKEWHQRYFYLDAKDRGWL